MALLPIDDTSRTPQPASTSPAPRPSDAETQRLAYQEIDLQRWQMIEVAYSKAALGVHNDLRELRECATQREYNTKRYRLIHNILTVQDTVLRALHGFLDEPEKSAGPAETTAPEKSALYSPDPRLER